MKDKVKMFREITYKLGNLYEKKSACYGDSFGETFRKLGLISAVTRISDKYNRLESLVTNENIDDLGESIEDTLKDLANYSIMTLMELEQSKPIAVNLTNGNVNESADLDTKKFNPKKGETYLCKCSLWSSLVKGGIYNCDKDGFITERNNTMIEISKHPSLDWNKYLEKQ